ncbi:SGNH/GDSL hydrolase family protein [uncultured Tateyamaria sp.]|uniref:SGNH/GDSL hydrolase family protein n=1 Tax=uncultured Tateyamaria sp. TaxID=455651 RepID=UPI0026200806|nr:SGNH/GDSL hydrolase family protein [uncultured Tateyamaria sp.]
MRLIVLVLWVMTGAASAEQIRVLAIGDSIMAWHKWTGRDIPSVMGDVLGARVDNQAVAASRFSNASALGRATGFDVRAQYRDGPWDVILINGGANDFLNDCRCRACHSVLNGLIAPDLTGEVPAFLARLRRSGVQVIWMGYYASARSGQFIGCRPYLVEYDARLARLAEVTPGLRFVDSEDVIDPSDRSLFAFDGIHPSPSGARRIGTYLAQSLAR